MNSKVRYRRRRRRSWQTSKTKRYVDLFSKGLGSIIFSCPKCSKSPCLRIFPSFDDEDDFGDSLCPQCIANRNDLINHCRVRVTAEFKKS